jgi:hypothetical protein
MAVINREYSYVVQLCWGVLLNHDPAHTWVVIMTEYAGYLDASGHPDDKPRVIVAGFIATEEQWLAFEAPWREALKKFELGGFFHMADFEGQKRKDRGIILDKLTDIINDNTTAHFSCSIDMGIYRQFNETHALEEKIGTPYSIAARGAARNINQWKEKEFKSGDHLLLFVEEGTRHHGDMEEAFRRDELPVPQKVPKSMPSVQPADLLAWEINHYEAYHDNRRSFMKLLSHGFLRKDAHGKFGPDNFLRTCLKADVPLRKDLPPNARFVYHSSPKRIRRRSIR